MNRLLVALFAWLIWALPQTAEGLVFQLPQGWRSSEDRQTRVITYTPPNVPAGKECAVMILPVRAATGTAQSLLEELIRTASTGNQLLAQPSFMDLGPYRVAIVTQQTRQGPQFAAFHIARWGTQAQAVIFFATDNGLFQLHGPAVQAMLAKTDLAERIGAAAPAPASSASASATSPAAAPARASGRPQVVEAFRRPGLRTYMNLDGSTFRGRVMYERIVLLSNGVADFSLYHAWGLGADPEILTVSPNTLNGFYGTWKAEGNTIRLRRQAGQPEEMLTRENGTLRFGDQVWTPMPRVDGLRLNGRYAYKSEPGGPLQYNYWVEFTADGRFRTGGVLTWIAVSDMTGRRKPPEPATGTYEIRDWTLFFSVNGVVVWTTDFMPIDDDVKNLSTILIDTFGFKRE